VDWYYPPCARSAWIDTCPGPYQPPLSRWPTIPRQHAWWPIDPRLVMSCPEILTPTSFHPARMPRCTSTNQPCSWTPRRGCAPALGMDPPVHRVLVPLEPFDLLTSGDIPHSDHCIQRSRSDELAIGRNYTSGSAVPSHLQHGRPFSRATEVIPASIGPCSLWMKSSMRRSNTH
jgi:hypothetical protein